MKVDYLIFQYVVYMSKIITEWLLSPINKIERIREKEEEEKKKKEEKFMSNYLWFLMTYSAHTFAIYQIIGIE